MGRGGARLPKRCLPTPASSTRAPVYSNLPSFQILAKYNIMALGLGFGVVAMANIRTGGQQQPMQTGMPPPNHGSAGFDYMAGQPGGGQVGNYQQQQMWFNP